MNGISAFTSVIVSKGRLWHLSLFLLVTTFSGLPCVLAQDLKSEELVEVARAAIKRIETIQGTYRTYFDSPKLKIPGIVTGPDGLGMYSEFRWAFVASDGRECLDGRWAYHQDGKILYANIIGAYNGKELRSLTRDNNSGKIAEVTDYFMIWTSPSVLWGRYVIGLPPRNLYELLEGATQVQLPDTPPHLRVLKILCKCGLEDMEIRVWLDSQHGFLPRRIETTNTSKGIIRKLIEVDDFHEVRASVWIPIRGQQTNYYSQLVLPDGVTRETMANMSADERKRLMLKTKFKAEKLGYGTQVYILDTKDLVVNELVPSERFSFEFPKDALIWDDFKRVGYQKGRFDDPEVKAARRGSVSNSSSSSSDSRGYGAVFWTSALLFLLASAFMIRRIRRQRA